MVVPYASLYPETRAALAADGWDAEYADVSGSVTAYADLLESVWALGETVIVVEQDIVPWPGALAILRDCPSPWCGFAYELGTGYEAWLGCTKFEGRLMLAHPDAFALIDAMPSDGVHPRLWSRLDTRLTAVLLGRGADPIHVHWPPVGHLNPDQKTRRA